MIVLAGVIS